MNTARRTMGLLASLLFAALFCSPVKNSSALAESTSESHQTAIICDKRIGFALSPKHLPHHSDSDLNEFFETAEKKAGFILLITQWSDEMPTPIIARVKEMAHMHDLKFFLQLSPTKLDGSRNTPDLPRQLSGKSFSDLAVQKAFKNKCMELAALAPDQLCVATEINFLNSNPTELAAFEKLYHEVYADLKRNAPSLPVTISFQYDQLKINNNWNIVDRFQPMDVVSFTSYPYIRYQDVAKLPSDYFDDARKHTPSKIPIGFSELGWSSDVGGQKAQSVFSSRIPELFKSSKPDYLAYALLNDVTLFSGKLAPLNHVGFMSSEGVPKESWYILAKQKLR